MGDATDMEHDTEEGSGEDATVREEEGPGGSAIDTEEESREDTNETEGPGVNNIPSTLDSYHQSQRLHQHLHERKRATINLV